MRDLKYLETELHEARQAQADAEFSRELAGEIVSKVAAAVQTISTTRLKILDLYIAKAIEIAIGGGHEHTV